MQPDHSSPIQSLPIQFISYQWSNRLQKRHSAYLIAFCFLGILFAQTQITHATPHVTFKSSAQVKQSEIYLHDIAQLKGFSKNDRKALKSYSLGRAPSAGTTLTLPKSYLKLRLDEAPLPKNTRIKYPKQIKVKRDLIKLSGQEIQSRLKKLIIAEQPQSEDIALLKTPQLANLSYPDGAELKLIIRSGVQGGRVPVDLKIFDGSRQIRSQRLFVQVDYYQNVVSLKNKLIAGATIRSEDLKIAKVPSSKVQRDTFLNPQDLAGARLRRSIDADIPIRRAWILTPNLIKRGSIIKMIFQTQGIFLSAEGEALGNGRRGDMIKVKNLRSRKIVTGKVTGINEVTMER